MNIGGGWNSITGSSTDNGGGSRSSGGWNSITGSKNNAATLCLSTYGSNANGFSRYGCCLSFC